ncbi:50S ribosomal protein L22 [candidate division TA06 bacterium DG_26]|uniref:Large ribosomal subunit protein uL22 n=1 Tax=candidate division TA06 bacterium DG_26 TaxID=1703771 RepID=A0A0S7WLC9_UNCT6|nr:MAG: 50S ribosomal protein L22 [candidate division TA06 bacterium DG_26]
MEARAVSRFVRVSPRKARAVVDLIRGKDVSEALTVLKFLRRRAGKFVEKVVKSAASNAIDIAGKNKLDMDRLYIKEARVDEGARMKRFRPRAYGRASMIRHRTSHITVVVEEKKA